MSRIFDEDQTSSLVSSMMNSESNATKFMEQGEDIGLPRDVTMDILNRYATYGANTGIGNLGGERLVNALNDEYHYRYAKQHKSIVEVVNKLPEPRNLPRLGFTEFGLAMPEELKDYDNPIQSYRDYYHLDKATFL